jgi:predicted phage tail component-like protein
MRFNNVTSESLGVVALAQQGSFLSAPRAATVDLPGVDGTMLAGVWQKAREFPYKLIIPASSAVEARQRCDAVAAWLSAGPAPLVADETPDRAWVARLDKALSFKSTGQNWHVMADVDLVADDPHGYALVDDTATLTSAGTVARAQGNAPSWPKLTVRGVLTSGASAQKIAFNLFGVAVEFQGKLTASERLVLDYQTFSFDVTDADGVPLRLAAGGLSTVTRVPCPPGGGTVSWSTTGTVTSVAVECNSRWL